MVSDSRPGGPQHCRVTRSESFNTPDLTHQWITKGEFSMYCKTEKNTNLSRAVVLQDLNLTLPFEGNIALGDKNNDQARETTFLFTPCGEHEAQC